MSKLSTDDLDNVLTINVNIARTSYAVKEPVTEH